MLLCHFSGNTWSVYCAWFVINFSKIFFQESVCLRVYLYLLLVLTTIFLFNYIVLVKFGQCTVLFLFALWKWRLLYFLILLMLKRAVISKKWSFACPDMFHNSTPSKLGSAALSEEAGIGFLQGFTFCNLTIQVVHKDNLNFQYTQCRDQLSPWLIKVSCAMSWLFVADSWGILTKYCTGVENL